MLAMIHMPGGWEWGIILLIALLIFGKRLPDIAKGLGSSIVEFKRGLKGVQDDASELTKVANEAVGEIKSLPQEVKKASETESKSKTTA